ncbi:MAG: zinc ribbon domain-containing protein [Anaerolineales bacterium]|nr:zinc ribbon domain-containing protein [Anaerolineales bacterium]
MNCPNCGAENEAGARFCVECGAPLETQVNLPSQPPEMDDMDDDRTIMSSFGRLAEEAKTVAVTQEQLAAAEAEVASAFERGPEPEPIPPAPRPIGGSGGSGGVAAALAAAAAAAKTGMTAGRKYHHCHRGSRCVMLLLFRSRWY